jgi:GTP cyclohydrolase I
MAVDKEKLKQAIRLFLEAIGEDPDREGLKGDARAGSPHVGGV